MTTAPAVATSPARLRRDTVAQAALLAAAVAQTATGTLGAADREGSSSRVGAISGKWPLTVVPADPAFAIWAPIYAGSLALAAYSALPDKHDDPVLRRLRLPATVAYAGNAFWVPAFTKERYQLALGCILTTLTGATTAYARTRPEVADLDRTGATLVRAPLGLLAGWITVATPSAVTFSLLSTGRTRVGLGPTGWAVALLTGCAGIASGVALRLKSSSTYPGAVAWGLAGVAAKRRHPPIVRVTAALAAATVAAVQAATTRRSSRASAPPSAVTNPPR